MEEQNNADYVYRGGYIGHDDGEGVRTVEVDVSVSFIEYGAFLDWHDLRCIRIPNTVSRIGDNAFQGCKLLASVTLPPSVTRIGNGAFYNCRSLTSVTLPPSLTTIDRFAFCDCVSLASVTLPPSLTSIGRCAFYECTSLTSMKLPPSITSIHSGAFEKCTSLVSLSLPPLMITVGTASSPNCFKKSLVEAGFSLGNPNDILSGKSTYNYNDTYYNLNTWARTIGADGRLPLVTAAQKSLKWYYMKQIFNANMPVINEVDAFSGLPLFMLAAAGPTSDIESVYNLLKESPHSLQYISTDSTMKKRKRKRGS